MSMNKDWNTVFIASLFEICWVIGLKHSNSMVDWGLTLIAIYISMHLLIMASRRLPVGTSYAVFAGIGTAGTVIADIVIFGEPIRLLKMALILLLVSGVIGLKLVTSQKDRKEVS